MTAMMTAVVRVNPAKARLDILRAYEKSRCDLTATSVLLDCSYNTLQKWVTALALQPRLDKLKARALREGWHHDKNRNGGRPRAQKSPTEARASVAKKRTHGAARAQDR